MSFIESVKTGFRKFATFSGRASRSEFWWFVLFYILVSSLLTQVDTMIFGPREVVMMSAEDGFETGMSLSIAWQPQPITAIFALVMLLPNIAISVRRLHDTNRSGWWALIGLIPLIGLIVLLVFFVGKGTGGDNDYGPDPLA